MVNMMVIIWLMMVNHNDWLVVEVSTPLKNDGVKVSWDDDIPNRWKNKTCSKPTSILFHFLHLLIIVAKRNRL